MLATQMSSGDPIADRRAQFALGFYEAGELLAAREVMTSALDLAPTWAAGWYQLGEWAEAAGDLSGAAEAWDHAVAADPADVLGAALKRDLARRVPVAETMSAGFVELLFDQYAHRFETSLVEGLAYRGPQAIMSALRLAGFSQAASALDLGCGTGLMGEVLRPVVSELIGCDLSAGMLAQAEAKSIYDRLDKADISDMDLIPKAYDLIVAADVFAYVGALEQVMGWAANSLRPGGWLAFTVEAAGPDEPAIVLRESRRFAQSRAYLEGLLADAGFNGVTIADTIVRMDRGQPIPSFCVTARAPVAALNRESEGDGESEVLA